MSAMPQAVWLPDGRRLHLHHGPIDLIVEAWGPQREACFASAVARFDSILAGLAQELDGLRQPIGKRFQFHDPVARQMAQAVGPFSDVFVTPMAAVAGAVADTVLQAMVAGRDVPKAMVNNGGDIAFHLSCGQSLTALGPAGRQTFHARDPARGIASSGWGGRSHSLGIADTVTVTARSAAQADVAATLIANAVDLPDHARIVRTPARDLSPDSDLGMRAVTTHVPMLSDAEIGTALKAGLDRAQDYCERGLIDSAALMLQGQSRTVFASQGHEQKQMEATHA